ncbi:hypothetical protein ATJ88_2598 [Isoptericola jiangsuensis]|uniref:Polyketide cyclase/dehydrase/lipid transport protein n=1 Tax=Isoptericola jiangsuensis TaxID=548579 RepID=A0A2A9EZZ7_9MICO|nr:hypothetical protein [Isoptericola jiangsuensis]PFG43882.1 hypothetical protein ATJ88_2598 [Isoptericola jiangsuensis]
MTHSTGDPTPADGPGQDPVDPWEDGDPAPRAPEGPAQRRARRLLAGVVLALFAAMLAAEALSATGLEQTSLFYVGIPALIAVSVVLTARPRHPVGIALATTTVGLALAGPLLDEGVVCLVVAAPLFYGVAAVVGLAVHQSRRRRNLVLAPLVLLLVLEGVGDASPVPRDDVATATTVVDATPTELAAALAAPPRYEPPRAALLRAVPFPVPVGAEGDGLAVGDERLVEFAPRHSMGLGAEPTPRSMRLRVTASDVRQDGGRVVFTVVEDSTLARWMDLRTAEVTWHGDGTTTTARWSLAYGRTFDPSWYFGPVQHHVTTLASGYLLDTFTDPVRP